MNETEERLLCIHQNQLFRQCLKWILEQDDRFAKFTIREVHPNDADLRNRITGERPQVALVDLNLPQRRAVEITRHVRQTLDGQVILLIPTAPERDEHTHDLLMECVEAGANGYVIEESSVEELKDALQYVLSGRLFCSPRLMQAMMDQLAVFSREARWRRNVKPIGLTRREQEILTWIAEGLSNKQVAAKLSLSTFTVKNHVHKILGKLDCSDRTEAVRRAVEEAWLSVPNLRVRA